MLPGAQISGVEQCQAALELAERNAANHNVSINLQKGSLFEPFEGQRFDLIVSNPPYIPTSDIESLQPEVRDHEPREALDGGVDGLDFYRVIIPTATDHLNPGGWLLFEVGIGQAERVLDLFTASGRFSELFIAKDPAGIDRVVGGRINPQTEETRQEA
jgi:release factor glutamine methyltransferase